MGRRKRTNFGDSVIANFMTYEEYMIYFRNLILSRFVYDGYKPEPQNPIDFRYIEHTLFYNGAIIWFRDDVTNTLCALKGSISGHFDMYGNPLQVDVIGENSYHRRLKRGEFVIMYNSLSRDALFPCMLRYARLLSDIDCSIIVNARAQKTPVLLRATESQRLTILNAYKEMDGNAPVIHGDKGLDPDSITVLKTEAPYTADRLYQLKCNYWNEAIGHIGIPNLTVQKSANLIKDEVQQNSGGTLASRASALMARQQAIEQVNDLFGTNIEVHFNDDILTDGQPDFMERGERFDGDGHSGKDSQNTD